MSSEQEDQDGVVTTTVMNPIGLVFDGWIVLEAKQVWSDLRYRFGTDDRKSNISFGAPPFGSVLVAIPTMDDPPEPPREIDGLKILPLEEFLYAVMQINKANETIRKNIYDQLNNTAF